MGGCVRTVRSRGKRWLLSLAMLIAAWMLFFASPAIAQQCPAASGAASTASCCDPGLDTCVARGTLRFGVTAGEYCLQGKYPQYPPPLDCNGSSEWRGDFPSEADAIQWRLGYEQAWRDHNAQPACGPITVSATTEWPTGGPTGTQSQGRQYTSGYPIAGSPPLGGNTSCQTPMSIGAYFAVIRYLASDATCPSGYAPAISSLDNSAVCKKIVPVEPLSCMADGLLVGNPILPATAEKYQHETRLRRCRPRGLELRAHLPQQPRPRCCQSDRSARQDLDPQPRYIARGLHVPHVPSSSFHRHVTDPEGYTRIFTQANASSPWVALQSPDTLTFTAGQPAPWTYRRAEDDSTSRFDTQASSSPPPSATAGPPPTPTTPPANSAPSPAPSPASSRSATTPSGQLISVTTPDARSISYAYDPAGRLSRVTAPDATSRTFLYDNPAFPHALTGILDQRGTRFASYGYDPQGRAITTEHAGGVDRYQLSYPSPGAATVIDPLGTTRSYTYATQAGQLAVTGGSLPSATGASDAASRTQDASGLLTAHTDFTGSRTTVAWDTTRRLPTATTRAAGTPAQQRTTTQWHPTFALPTLVTETGRTTSFTYDPSGNLLARTVTDTASPPHTPRTWQWTYTPQGLVDTQTAPNGAVTRHSHDPSGNLTRSVNALGHETQFAYDNAGRLVRSTAPNGLATTYTWDARDRLLTRTLGAGTPAAQTTTFGYLPTGPLAALALPTGLIFTFDYDDAQRLTGWRNNRGHSGTFTLDAIGNRLAEQVNDPTGAIAWRAVRSVNQINRLATRTEGSNQTTTFGYDPNGDVIARTNALNQSTRYALDPLGRLAAITDAANATATLAYDPQDDLILAKDFKGVATTYTRQLGQPTQERSPDIGTRATQYDALGLPRTIVDALGQATTITRDPIGRPIQLNFADGTSTTLRYDLSPQSRGYLSEFTDRSGTTTYTRDAFARVIAKRQSLANGLVQQVSYSYTPGGQLASLTYPNGKLLGYRYDPTGRLTQLDWDGAPLITNLAWNPLGQPTAWTWAFVNPAHRATRTYDSAARPDLTEFSRYIHDGAGRITHIAQALSRPGDGDPTHDSLSASLVFFNADYDPVGRVRSFWTTADTASYGYDANGNRTSSTRTRPVPACPRARPSRKATCPTRSATGSWGSARSRAGPTPKWSTSTTPTAT